VKPLDGCETNRCLDADHPDSKSWFRMSALRKV